MNDASCSSSTTTSPSFSTGAKTAERAPDHDAGLPRRDPLALVTALGVGQPGVQHGDAVAEARPEAADGLRRERDLRDEHDDPAATGERSRGGLEVHLGLAAPRRPVEEHMATPASSARTIRSIGGTLRRRELLRLGLTAESVARRGRTRRPATSSRDGRDERQCPGRRRAVVVREPERQLDQRGRDPIDDGAGVRDLDARRRSHPGLDDDPRTVPPAEPDREDVALPDVVGHAST